MADKTKKFFKDILAYSSSNIFANLLNFITGIIVRRILQPTLMGLLNELMLIFEYSRYSQLGIIESLDRELPYFHGSRDYKKVELLKDIGFTFCLAVASATGIALFIASIFIKLNIGDRLLINSIRIVSFMAALHLINSLYIVLNRSRHNFFVISKHTLIVAILDIITKIFLVIKFGLYGLLWASVLTWMLGLVYFYKASKIRFRILLNFPFGELRRLFKIGFPIFIMGFVFMTLRNIDRIMIIKLLDRQSLGFYTIALMVSVYIVQLPNLIYAIIFPRFYQAYGERKNIFEIKELFIKPTIVFAYLFPILIGAVIITLPLLVSYILPSYLPGLLPAYLLLLGSSFLAFVNMPGYLLIALNKQIYMILIGVIGIFLGVILNYLFVAKFNLGLKGIALATSITYFLYTTILMAFAFKHYTNVFILHLKFFAQLYLPILWVAIVLFLLKAFVFKISGNLSKDFFTLSYKWLVFLLSCLPLIAYVNRKTAIISLIKKTYFGK